MNQHIATQMQFRFVGGTFICDWGQGFPFDLPPCEADETVAVMPFEPQESDQAVKLKDIQHEPTVDVEVVS